MNYTIKKIDSKKARYKEAYTLHKLADKVNIDKKYIDWANSVLNAECLLVKNGHTGTYELVKKNQFGSMIYSDGIIVETFGISYGTIIDLPQYILNKYKIVDSVLQEAGIEVSKNCLLDDISKAAKKAVEIRKGKVIEHYITDKIKVVLVKFNNQPQVINKTCVHMGLLIGKGGVNIKNMAHIAGLRYIKLI